MLFRVHEQSMIDRLRLLKLTLQISGAATTLAFAAMLLPVEWMAEIHHRLGLGAFPRAPVTEYLARSISLLYGFHGILTIIVGTDPVRYRPIVTYIASMYLVTAVAIAAIDIHAGMPWWWTVGESGTIGVLGLLLTFLNVRRSVS